MEFDIKNIPNLVTSYEAECAQHGGREYDYFDPEHLAEFLSRKLPSLSDHARWIECTSGLGKHECSRCHTPAKMDDWDDSFLSKRCPECGAEMELENSTKL